jgi:hypothetical protein
MTTTATTMATAQGATGYNDDGKDNGGGRQRTSMATARWATKLKMMATARWATGYDDNGNNDGGIRQR